jgi:hypothetical protein
MEFEKIKRWYGLTSPGSGQGPVAGCEGLYSTELTVVIIAQQLSKQYAILLHLRHNKEFDVSKQKICLVSEPHSSSEISDCHGSKYENDCHSAYCLHYQG